MYSLHYHLASPEDLGRPNNGGYHHIRAQPISNAASNSSTHSRRNDEQSNGGVVADYLWTNGENSLWNELGGKSQADNLGSTIEYYTENSESQVYNHAYKFKVKSGSWLDGCGGAAGSSAPPPLPPPPPHVACSPV